MTDFGWIGVDLDGTLAFWDGWHGIEPIGEPIEPMVARVKQWLAEGQEVRIFTARVSGTHGEEIAARRFVEIWCQRVLGQTLPVTCIKDGHLLELWDDRAVQVERNMGRVAVTQVVSQ